MRVRVVVDRVEGDKAVLFVGSDETGTIWPRDCLPAGAGEGDVLFFDLNRDEKATRQAREEAAELLRQLTKTEKDIV